MALEILRLKFSKGLDIILATDIRNIGPMPLRPVDFFLQPCMKLLLIFPVEIIIILHFNKIMKFRWLSNKRAKMAL